MAKAHKHGALLRERVEHQHARVAYVELFFDLVFVFAITQVTAFMADDLGWRGALRGLVLLALMWWAWCSYAWLGNQARADEGVVRGAMIGAMAALFLVALAIPEAWGDEGGGISAPVLLAVCLGLVRLGHLGVYVIAAGSDTALRQTVLPREILGRANAAILVCTAGVLPGVAIGAGILAELTSIRFAVWVGVAIGLAVPLFLLPLRRLREMPTG